MDCLLAGERCVTDLATTLELNQPRVSHHLGVLRRHSLVVVRRDGKHVFYRVDPRWRPEADTTGRELHLGPITLRFLA